MKQIKTKTKLMKVVEKRENEKIEEVLRRKYVNENKPTHTIANELKISYLTAIKWIKLAGVHSRKLDL